MIVGYMPYAVTEDPLDVSGGFLSASEKLGMQPRRRLAHGNRSPTVNNPTTLFPTSHLAMRQR